MVYCMYVLCERIHVYSLDVCVYMYMHSQCVEIVLIRVRVYSSVSVPRTTSYQMFCVPVCVWSCSMFPFQFCHVSDFRSPVPLYSVEP